MKCVRSKSLASLYNCQKNPKQLQFDTIMSIPSCQFELYFNFSVQNPYFTGIQLK